MKSLKNSYLHFLFVLFVLLLIVYSVFSYSLTDPNLILTSWSPYWSFQQWMWQTFFNNRVLLSYTYGLLIGLLFIVYLTILHKLKKSKFNISNSKRVFIIFLLALPLLFSYNTLSHDIFNYIFNAKIVLLFKANPHVSVALDYAYDDWTRFMHNTHTPAPYGYGWTALSLIPYSVGFGKFLPTWLIFRLFSLLSLGLLYSVVSFVAKQLGQKLSSSQLAIVFLNPLVLIEIISNSHNDLWMMTPAVLSLGLLLKRKLKFKYLVLSLLLLVFSISIKFATLMLVPLWLAIVIAANFKKLNNFLQNNWALLASVLMFLPLFTARSQQFLPWYLIWSLVWLPFIQNKFWRNTVLLLSISAMFRYLPWMWAGGFGEIVLRQQMWVTWIPAAIYVSLNLLGFLLTNFLSFLKIKS